VDDLGSIPENVIVVATAPQLDLLKRADLCITHAGLNTALEALGQGVPLLAIPIGYDQPGVAARIAHHHVGEFVEIGDLTPERLALLIQRIVESPSYHKNAERFQRLLAKARGLDLAADLLEHAFHIGRVFTTKQNGLEGASHAD
jgi:MGT family glycosyltransferase